MKAYTYIDKGRFELTDKPKPQIMEPTDAIVRVTLGSICSSDIHIKHGSVPRAVKGITVGHEMVGIVKEIGSAVTNVKPGDRVTVNVETFCGECFYCRHGYVNNCSSPNGGWALGCRIDGGQTEYVRVPFANQGLNLIPENVTDEQALFVGDVLATGFWAARISEITSEDTVLIIGAGPTGICTLLCVILKQPKRIIVCEKSEERQAFIRKYYPEVLLANPNECEDFVREHNDHGGADRVIEVAGGKDTFQLAWKCARPNAIVTVVALYDAPQVLPLPDMYGKNLTFKTGGVDGCDCEEILRLIADGKIDTTPLITHRFPLSDIEKAYRIFENKEEGVIKIAVYPDDVMESGRLLLRPWHDEDAETLYQYASNPAIGEMAGWPPHKSVEESREVIRNVFSNPTTWAIALKDNPAHPIGAIGYGSSCECGLPDALPGEPCIGYWIAQPYWGKGISTEALQLMIEHIRTTTDIKSIISGHFTDNPASGRVMEKCGFTATGTICETPGMYAAEGRAVRSMRLQIKTIENQQ